MNEQTSRSTDWTPGKTESDENAITVAAFAAPLFQKNFSEQILDLVLVFKVEEPLKLTVCMNFQEERKSGPVRIWVARPSFAHPADRCVQKF